MFAYVVRPVGDGPFPLVIMNHGVSLNPTDRGFFPLVEFRDAAMWFARRGNLVVAPVGSGYGAAAHDLPELGIYGPFFSKIGKCTNPNFRDAGLAVALVDLWIIEYMTREKMAVPRDVIGESAGTQVLDEGVKGLGGHVPDESIVDRQARGAPTVGDALGLLEGEHPVSRGGP